MVTAGFQGAVGTRPLQLRTPAEWRRWLEAHHDTETEALLFLSKKSVPDGVHYEEALEEALCFGWIDGKLRAHDARQAGQEAVGGVDVDQVHAHVAPEGIDDAVRDVLAQVAYGAGR